MTIFKISTIVFGSSTGSTEYGHQLFNKPTLYLDSACSYNTGTIQRTVHRTKVKNKDYKIFEKIKKKN